MSSFQPNPSAVKSLLHGLLPSLARAPYPGPALAKLPLLCSGLLQLGSVLEQDCSTELDILQAMFTELCADTRVDIQLRLQALEVVELRSLGWKRSSEITEAGHAGGGGGGGGGAGPAQEPGQGGGQGGHQCLGQQVPRQVQQGRDEE